MCVAPASGAAEEAEEAEWIWIWRAGRPGWLEEHDEELRWSHWHWRDWALHWRPELPISGAELAVMQAVAAVEGPVMLKPGT